MPRRSHESARTAGSRGELARRAGVSPATITRLENGEHRGPLLSTIVHVAQALDVTTEELLAE